MQNNHLAIIGSGPTSLFMLKHISDNASMLKNHFSKISIFEKEEEFGMGMPFNPNTTDIYNLSNISSEEIPYLEQSLAQWLGTKSEVELKNWHIEKNKISEGKLYTRIILGKYFNDQFKQIIQKLKNQDFDTNQYNNTYVKDIIPIEKSNIKVLTDSNESYSFSKVVISVGHNWVKEDDASKLYFVSPWPIKKILPKKDNLYNFPVGLLGASLSAFDVVSSLAHRHGIFTETEDGLNFKLKESCPNFKLVMHAAQGWLPQLQYEQVKPIRKIYRHNTREEILRLVDADGFLHINTFFNIICKPALIEALLEDGENEVAKQMENHAFEFKNFVDTMSQKHQYLDSFLDLEKELVVAQENAANHKPIHWMETLDDLMYCLNFHADLLTAESHLYFRQEVMPFLMNVIAALPLESAKILLALYRADCIELVKGHVQIMSESKDLDSTKIKIENPDEDSKYSEFKMFVECAGQKTIDSSNYPFEGLLKANAIHNATAQFFDNENANIVLENNAKAIISADNNSKFLEIGGIAINPDYSLATKKDDFDCCVYDVSLSHVSGIRPYSYGLQACNAISLIVIDSWLSEFKNRSTTVEAIKEITEIYKDNDEL